MPKQYSKDVKELTLKVYSSLLKEKQNGRLPFEPFERAETLTGINQRTIRRWSQAQNDLPTQKKEKSRHFKSLDTFDIDVIMREVRTLVSQRKFVTTRTLQKILEERGVQVSKATIWRVFRSQGLRFKKTAGNRKMLCERPDLQAKRCKFLRQLKKVKSLKKNVIYLDETWVNVHHTSPQEWTSLDGDLARNIPPGKGQRLILLHAVDDKTGFLPGCKLLFKSYSTDGRDYHTEMNAEIFEKWVEEKLIPAAPAESVIVMDNAPYHSRRLPESVAPTSAARKADIQAWLRRKKIPFPENALKPELYSLVKKHKGEPVYAVDEMIKAAKGLQVLRLPPYHCELNPIEMLWGIVKNDVGRRNTTFKIQDMKGLTEEAIDAVSLESIQKTFAKTAETEDQYWKKDGVGIAPVYSNFIVNPNESSSESESESSSDED